MNNRPKNWNPNGTNNPMVKCQKCGAEFKRMHNRQIYCDRCAPPKIGSRSQVVDHTKTVFTRGCKRCGEHYDTNAPSQKFCMSCIPLAKAERDKAAKEAKKKGYNQLRENNNNWKGGIGIYIHLAFVVYEMPKKCNRCGSTRNLVVHHKDRNRHNNDKANLEPLCKSCHQVEHEAGKNLHPHSMAFKSNKV